MRNLHFSAALLSMGLAACNSEPAMEQSAALDPVMTEALHGQLMVDPDLSQQNMANQAIIPGGPVDPALPLPD